MIAALRTVNVVMLLLILLGIVMGIMNHYAGYKYMRVLIAIYIVWGVPFFLARGTMEDQAEAHD